MRRTIEGSRHFRLRTIGLDLDEGPDGFAVYVDVGRRRTGEVDLRREADR
ncbi:hypothetical protein [Halovivax sp.]|nr:hypothetical protein [Halovivax sp.]